MTHTCTVCFSSDLTYHLGIFHLIVMIMAIVVHKNLVLHHLNLAIHVYGLGFSEDVLETKKNYNRCLLHHF